MVRVTSATNISFGVDPYRTLDAVGICGAGLCYFATCGYPVTVPCRAVAGLVFVVTDVVVLRGGDSISLSAGAVRRAPFLALRRVAMLPCARACETGLFGLSFLLPQVWILRRGGSVASAISLSALVWLPNTHL